MEKYNIKIENERQPLLVVKDKKKENPDLMIPELCLMTGLPDNFDEFRRKKISESTIKSPGEKKREITTLMEDLQKEQFQSLRDLGISLENEMAVVKAKSIPNPTLQLGEGKQIDKGREAGFQLFANPIYGNKY